MSDDELEGGRLVSDPNANRPGYKETKVGWIPEDWELRRMCEVVAGNSGIKTGPFGSQLHKADYIESGVPVIMPTNMRRGSIDPKGIAQITEEKANSLNEQRCKTGDIVFARRGEIGRCAIVRKEQDRWLNGTGSLRIRAATDKMSSEFAFFAVCMPRQLHWLNTNAVGQTMLNLSAEIIQDLPLPIPPLPEQRKIAEILRTWDEAIEAATKLVTALNTRREALRTKLVVEAGLGGRPAVFGEFLTESRILGSDGASARKITVKLYGKGAVPKSDKRDGSAKTRYYRRSPGQLIYSKLDFLNGAFALIPEALQGYESSLDLPAFDISEHVNPKWLIEYLTRPAYYTAQVHLARGQRKARRIAPNDFLASPVKLPQRDRQDEIAAVLAVADREIALRETELDSLTRQKRGLMQKLLTGEWRVNTTDFCHPDLRGRK